MTPERRETPRRRTLATATLRYAAKTATLSCRVRNMTACGARLELEDAHWAPERFELDIPHQNVRAGAHVVWRHGSALGVAFDAPVRVFHDMGCLDAQGQHEMHRDQRDRLIFLEQERARLQARLKELTGESS
jgi:PilZ domain